MPIFRLSPEPSLLRDPDWDASPYRGDIFANATDETEARGLAAGRYEDARANIPGTSAAPSPWSQARLVTATELAEPPGGLNIPPGVVVGDRQI